MLLSCVCFINDVMMKNFFFFSFPRVESIIFAVQINFHLLSFHECFIY